MEDSEVVLVLECNSLGLKELSSFVWTDKSLVCLPKFHLSFKARACTQVWTAFFIFQFGLSDIRINCNSIIEGLLYFCSLQYMLHPSWKPRSIYCINISLRTFSSHSEAVSWAWSAVGGWRAFLGSRIVRSWPSWESILTDRVLHYDVNMFFLRRDDCRLCNLWGWLQLSGPVGHSIYMKSTPPLIFPYFSCSLVPITWLISFLYYGKYRVMFVVEFILCFLPSLFCPFRTFIFSFPFSVEMVNYIFILQIAEFRTWGSHQ
jgi:hypothetical protein